MTILIIGGTGRVGGAVITQLAGQGETLRCLSHNKEKLARLPAGVEHSFADLDDPACLPGAFEAVDTVLLSLAVHPNEEPRGLVAIDAAIEAGVKKIVHISLVHTPGSEDKLFYQAKRSIEARLRSTDLTVTTIRPANFYQSDDNLKQYILGSGLYPPPIGSKGVDRLDARDVGFVAAKALHESEYDGQEVELYGPVRHTGASVAETFSQIFGKPVEYMGDDIDRWRELNVPRLGDWYVTALSGLYEQQQAVGMRRPDDVPLHPLLPKAMITLDGYVRERKEIWQD